MKTIEEFKRENEAWLENVISDYLNDMSQQECEGYAPSDCFNDTLSVAREKCDDEELALEVKAYIEDEVMKRLN